MSSFDTIARTASAAVCSLILTAVSIGAAAGPIATSGAVPAVYAALHSGGQANG